MTMTPEQVIAFAKENKVKAVDIRFMDFPGIWQHFTIPLSELNESGFDEGFGFDGSSIRGWQPINASDMMVIPDPSTAKIDPFFADKTLVLIGNIADPITREAYSRDPRNIAMKAEAYLKSTGIGDTAYFGPEAEFFIFDNVQYHSGRNSAFYELDSVEAVWNTGREEMPNQGYKVRHKEGYVPVPPADKFQDLRSEMMLVLEEMGIAVERQHHEVATAGQAEIDMRFKPLVEMGDQLVWFKYILKNVAYRKGHTVDATPF
ncbi:MAG: glutamine synthetase beta-grasp domain-containing protein [Desulfobacterales bacterium]